MNILPFGDAIKEWQDKKLRYVMDAKMLLEVSMLQYIRCFCTVF